MSSNWLTIRINLLRMAELVDRKDILELAGNPPEVLLVDDERYALEEYQELLDLDGICAIIETNPFKAIEKTLDTPSIRAVVTDQRMPQMSGAELISQLHKRLAPDRQVKYLILSGYLEGISETKDIPSVKLLEKPVDATELSDAIRNAISGGTGA